jgi:phosphoacetylglucosamine mutase
LLAYLEIANAVVGDSMADLLLVEASLLYLNIDLIQLSKLYSDLPSVTIKAAVKDKSLFVPCEDEQKLVKPLEVQEFIDKVCGKYELGRAFVRPSGTEDILRLYAEAKTYEMTISLSNEIKDYLKKFE